MQCVPVTDSSLAQACAVIRGGGVVAHATETCYGLACDLMNVDAVRKLFAIKKRPKRMPVSALVASIEDAKKFVEWNAKAQEFAEEHWPGALTIVLSILTSEQSSPTRSQQLAGHLLLWTTLGVRMSSHPVAQKLIELCGVPLSTTSANLHGQPEPYSSEEILRQFHEQALQPDLILDSGTLPQTKPSTVIAIRNGEIEVLRQGGISVVSKSAEV